MMLEGVISILEGMNPRMLEIKLAGFLDARSRTEKKEKARMRPRVHRSRVTHDRWLVSYADFITLLFAFFVVLYAFAKADQKKQVQIASSIDCRLPLLRARSSATLRPSGALFPASENPGLPVNVVMGEAVLAPQQVKLDLNRIQRRLEQTLSTQVAAHAVSIHMGRDGLVISLREAGFFDSGSAIPSPQTLPTLRQIAASLAQTPYRPPRRRPHRQCAHPHLRIRFQLGALHRPRHPHRPPLPRSQSHVPGRISAAGYAEFHPVAANDTPEGRAQNRRVDLIVLPRTNIDLSTPPVPHSTGPWRKITDN